MDHRGPFLSIHYNPTDTRKDKPYPGYNAAMGVFDDFLIGPSIQY